jgi:hypothetical protein
MPTVQATAPLDLTALRAESLWLDVRRWPTFIDGFARVLQHDSAWPEPGAKLVWESVPSGRGRVTERVAERSDLRFVTEVYDERAAGRQTVTFDPGEVALSLEYELAARGPFAFLTDLLFIRRLQRQSLERTVRRFAVEAAEESSL